MTPIYLDHNSTTPIAPEVADAMLEVYRAGYVNPASQHQLGQRARRRLEETREAIIALLGGKTSGMDADRLIFTSGGTEANNLALRGLAGKPPARIVVSSVEHPSVLGPAEYLSTQGFQVDRIRVDARGTIDLGHISQLLQHGEHVRLVSVMSQNNETGARQSLSFVRTVSRMAGSLLHVDAVQSVGKSALPWQQYAEISAMTVAAHKFNGPVGIGALLLRQDVKLEPQLFGGFQQEGLRPGTESLALAVGMHRALELALANLEQRVAHLSNVRDAFVSRLKTDAPDIVVTSPGESIADCSLSNTTNIAFLGCDRQELLLALDRAGVCCSTGSACASGSSEPSPVLVAMGLPDEVIRSSLRFSFGITNTLAEGAEAARRICQCVNELRARKSQRNSPFSPRQPG
jgi:cysteine desulfurase